MTGNQNAPQSLEINGLQCSQDASGAQYVIASTPSSSFTEKGTCVVRNSLTYILFVATNSAQNFHSITPNIDSNPMSRTIEVDLIEQYIYN